MINLESVVLPDNIFFASAMFLITMGFSFIVLLFFTRKLKYLASKKGLSWINTAFSRFEKSIYGLAIIASIFAGIAATGVIEVTEEAHRIVTLIFVLVLFDILYKLALSFFEYYEKKSKHFSIEKGPSFLAKTGACVLV